MTELVDFGGHLTFPSIFLWLVGYWIVERTIKNIFQYFVPAQFDTLYRERKDAQYFTFIMGVVITAVSTPICYKAFSDSNDFNDTLGSPNLSREGQICIATRSVLWASELNRLDHSMGYIKHHLGSLGHLVYQLQAKMPMRLIYAIYTSLLTELFSDLVCILAIHGIKDTNSPLAYRIRVINTALLALLRIPAAIYAATFIPIPKVSDPRFWLNILSIFIYSRFLVRTFLAASDRLQLFQFVSTRPAHFRVAQAAKISLYSIFLALASFITAIISAVLYIQNSPQALTPSHLWGLRAQLLATGFSAFLGARIPSVLFRHKLRGIFSFRIFTQKWPLDSRFGHCCSSQHWSFESRSTISFIVCICFGASNGGSSRQDWLLLRWLLRCKRGAVEENISTGSVSSSQFSCWRLDFDRLWEKNNWF
ncbi:hypothetical protein B0J14DRAFT_231321 [Halenospora varia]|nr:hypothetical protein B0J14DRAFT_231321 [Halenospora varia]